MLDWHSLGAEQAFRLIAKQPSGTDLHEGSSLKLNTSGVTRIEIGCLERERERRGEERSKGNFLKLVATLGWKKLEPLRENWDLQSEYIQTRTTLTNCLYHWFTNSLVEGAADSNLGLH